MQEGVCLKAVVKTKRGKGFVELAEVPEPRLGLNEVLVEVKAAGICGTDIHIYRDEFMYTPPVILGHEFCGVIAEVGENITGWDVGDRVTCETSGKVCGRCYLCRAGRYNLCPQRLGLGYHLNGAFAKYILVPRQEILHKLPDNVDFISGALSEPSAVVVHGIIELSPISPGDSVVITGPGPVGLLALQIAKIAGAETVMITGTDVDKERLELAMKLGADLTINVQREDPIKTVQKLTNGHGADIVIECSGFAKAAEQTLQIVSRGGSYVQIGLFGEPFELDFDQVVYKELRVYGAWSHVWSSWERALKLMALGRLQTKPLVSHVLPISEWTKGFELMEKKQGIKVVLTPI